jgi:hypothetical protein
MKISAFENIFIFAFTISFLFFFCKFVESRMLMKKDEENQVSLKPILRDTLIVYFVVLASDFLINQIVPKDILKVIEQPKQIEVFVDNPNF